MAITWPQGHRGLPGSCGPHMIILLHHALLRFLSWSVLTTPDHAPWTSPSHIGGYSQSVMICSQRYVPFSRPYLGPVSVTSPPPLRTSPTCPIARIGADHTRLDPSHSQSKPPSDLLSEQPSMTSEM